MMPNGIGNTRGEALLRLAVSSHTEKYIRLLSEARLVLLGWAENDHIKKKKKMYIQLERLPRFIKIGLSVQQKTRKMVFWTILEKN